jgi:tetratricopeptide (TPR) repeat protein
MNPFSLSLKLSSLRYGFLLCGVLLRTSSAIAADSAVIDRVKIAIEKRDFSAAQKELDAVLALNSYDEAALTQKVRMLYFQGKAVEARKLADMVLAEYPRNTEVLNVRGILLSAAEPQGALEDFNAALQANPKNYKALVNRARTLERLGKKHDALADYDAAIALAPEIGVLYGERAALRLSLIKTEQEKDAIELVKSDVERALQTNPKDVDAWITRGWQQWLTKDDAQAFRSFHTAYQLNRNSSSAQQGLSTSAYNFKEATGDEATLATIWQDACVAFEQARYDEASWERLEWASELLRLRAKVSNKAAYETFHHLDSLLEKDPQNVRLIYYRNAGYFRPENDAKLRALVAGDARTRDARFTALAAIALAQSEVTNAFPSEPSAKENYKRAAVWCREATDIVPDLPEAGKMIQTISARIEDLQRSKEAEQIQDANTRADFQKVYALFKQWESYQRSQVSLVESKMNAAKRAMNNYRSSSNRSDQYAVERYNNEIKAIYRNIYESSKPALQAIATFRDSHTNLSPQLRQMLNDMSKSLQSASTAYSMANIPQN